MTSNKTQRKEELRSTIRDALSRAEAYCTRYRPWDTRLLVIGIVCGAIGTLLAAGTVAGGKPVLDAFGGWKILCSIVAVFTAAGTVASAVHKSLQITTRVASAEKCVARLRALDATIVATDVPVDEVLDSFRQISEEHSVCLV